jgi:hypothetical protein
MRLALTVQRKFGQPRVLFDLRQSDTEEACTFPQFVFIRAGTLDEPGAYRPQMVVFSTNGQSWDRVDPSLPLRYATPNPSLQPTRYGLRPPRAAELKR